MDTQPKTIEEQHDWPEGDQSIRHKWMRIDYEDDVVPWHCMVCGTFNPDDWEGRCPGEKAPA